MDRDTTHIYPVNDSGDSVPEERTESEVGKPLNPEDLLFLLPEGTAGEKGVTVDQIIQAQLKVSIRSLRDFLKDRLRQLQRPADDSYHRTIEKRVRFFRDVVRNSFASDEEKEPHRKQLATWKKTLQVLDGQKVSQERELNFTSDLLKMINSGKLESWFAYLGDVNQKDFLKEISEAERKGFHENMDPEALREWLDSLSQKGRSLLVSFVLRNAALGFERNFAVGKNDDFGLFLDSLKQVEKRLAA